MAPGRLLMTMVATPPAGSSLQHEFPALAQVRAELEAYKRKFYLSLLLRGALITAALLLSLFVVFNALEYFLYLPTAVRAVLLFGFVAGLAYAVVRWLWQPVAALTNLRRLLSDEQAARQVGELFPQVQDRLLNALQLQGQARDNELLLASLEQRAAQLRDKVNEMKGAPVITSGTGTLKLGDDGEEMPERKIWQPKSKGRGSTRKPRAAK